ncbi:hypothetical protein FI667_g14653, partial [Globisporangium splendens]
MPDSLTIVHTNKSWQTDITGTSCETLLMLLRQCKQNRPTCSFMRKQTLNQSEQGSIADFRIFPFSTLGSMGDVYKELLASLDRRVLRAPCDQFMGRHLALMQKSVEDATAALRRLQDVTRAAQKLRRAPLEVDQQQQQLKTMSARLRRKTAKAFKRMKRRMTQLAGGDEERGGGGDDVFHIADDDADDDNRDDAVQTPDQGVNARKESPKDVILCAEPVSHVASCGDMAVESSASHCAKGLSKVDDKREVEAGIRTTALRDAVIKLKNDPANRGLLELVQSYMRIADDFSSRPLSDQVTVIQAYAADTKAAMSIFATKYASRVTHEQRSILGLVFMEAIDVVVSFVTEKACESTFEATILLGILDCIVSIQASWNDYSLSDLERFEQLLVESLPLWDVANDDTVSACVQHMMTVASKVDGSCEDKAAARTQKLNAFRNLLADEAI